MLSGYFLRLHVLAILLFFNLVQFSLDLLGKGIAHIIIVPIILPFARPHFFARFPILFISAFTVWKGRLLGMGDANLERETLQIHRHSPKRALAFLTFLDVMGELSSLWQSLGEPGL
jgi:hypothetical protein